MAIPGKWSKLKILEVTRSGFYLDNDGEKVLLPAIETPFGKKPGDTIEVFLYVNEKGEVEATLETPLIELNQVAPLIAVHSSDNGAFFDMGIKRDLFVPPNEQKIPIEKGKRYLVVMKYDYERKSLYGATRLKPYFRDGRTSFEEGQKVKILVVKQLEEGYEVIINMKVFGFLHYNDITIPNIHVGHNLKAYVKKKDRDRYMVSLQKEGPEQIDAAAQKLYSFIVNNNGYVRLNDESDPEEIKLRLHMSKKLFKKAAGQLFKEEKVIITKRGIKLNKRK